MMERASLVIGPLLSSSVRAIAPVVRQQQVPVVAFSNDGRVGGDGIYVMGFTPAAEVSRVMDFAARNGAARFGVAAPDNAYGATIVNAAYEAARVTGAAITAAHLYSPETSDFAPVLDRLGIDAPAPAPPAADGVPDPPAPVANPPFEALLLADSGPRLRALVAHLAAAGVNARTVRLLGTGAWDERELSGERAFAGAWFAAPPSAFRQDFENRFRAAFGSAPHRLATLAYDATALAAIVAQERAAQRDVPVTSVIEDPAGFLGRDGLFRFGPDGVAERRLAVLQIEPGGVRVVSEPALSFAGS
jgi:ABC-type branched-subunit amino acid transport system substrate-binding protein